MSSERHDNLTRRLVAAAYMSGFVAGLDATAAFFIFPSVRDGLADGHAAAASWLLTIVGIIYLLKRDTD